MFLIAHHGERLQEALRSRGAGRRDIVSISSHAKWRYENWNEWPLDQKFFSMGETMAHLVHLVCEERSKNHLRRKYRFRTAVSLHHTSEGSIACIDLIIESRNVFTGTDGTARRCHRHRRRPHRGRPGHAAGRARLRALETNAGGLAPEVRFRRRARGSRLPRFPPALLPFGRVRLAAGHHVPRRERGRLRRAHAGVRRAAPERWLLARWREYPLIRPCCLEALARRGLPHPPRGAVLRRCPHAVAQPAALAELGLTRDSVPPAGGSYDRDEAGELTGIVREAAAMELMPQIMGSFTDDEVASAYRGFFARLAENGVTERGDDVAHGASGLDFIRDDACRPARARRADPRACTSSPRCSTTCRFETMPARYTGPYLQAPGFKQFFDSVSQHTAWVTEPYANARRRRLPAAPRWTPPSCAPTCWPPSKAIPCASTPSATRPSTPRSTSSRRRAQFGPLPRRHQLPRTPRELPARKTSDRLRRTAGGGAAAAAHDASTRAAPSATSAPSVRIRFIVAVPHAARPLHGARVRDGLARGGRELDGRAVQCRELPIPAPTSPAAGGCPTSASAEAHRFPRRQRRGGGAAARAGHASRWAAIDLAVLDATCWACDADDIQKTNTGHVRGGTCVFQRRASARRKETCSARFRGGGRGPAVRDANPRRFATDAACDRRGEGCGDPTPSAAPQSVGASARSHIWSRGRCPVPGRGPRRGRRGRPSQRAPPPPSAGPARVRRRWRTRACSPCRGCSRCRCAGRAARRPGRPRRTPAHVVGALDAVAALHERGAPTARPARRRRAPWTRVVVHNEPASTSASGMFGVTTSASGSRRAFRARRRPRWRGARAARGHHDGIDHDVGRPWRSSASAMASMMAADDTMPHLHGGGADVLEHGIDLGRHERRVDVEHAGHAEGVLRPY